MRVGELLAGSAAFAPLFGSEHRLQGVDLIGHEAALIESTVRGALGAARSGQDIDQPAQPQGEDDDRDEAHDWLPFKPFTNLLS